MKEDGSSMPTSLPAPPSLLAAAREVAARAYCPYSHYPVGAALLATDGRVFTGCNVENASYGLTICAERVALTRAVADGARQFATLALVAGTDQPATPCGACLQVLVEFCAPDMPVHFDTIAGGRARTLPLRDFLPHAFRLAPQESRSSGGSAPAADA